MNDSNCARFIIYKGFYNQVKRVLKSESSSSSVNKGGIECILFEDESSVSMPSKEKPRNNFLTIHYPGMNYPSYVGRLSGHIKRMRGFRMGRYY